MLQVGSLGKIKRVDELFAHAILFNDILARFADRKGSIATVISNATHPSLTRRRLAQVSVAVPRSR